MEKQIPENVKRMPAFWLTIRNNLLGKLHKPGRATNDTNEDRF
ncbi:MAG: hypothetical protein ACUVQ1_04880 [Candidatus Kapaibacteriales bacterium]